jgi:hypothetical protein
MFDRIEMNIVKMYVIISLISDLMFPETALPNGAFIAPST